MEKKPDHLIAEAVQAFALTLSADDAQAPAAVKASTAAMMKCIAARGGVRVLSHGKEYVDNLIAEAVRNEIMDRARSMLLAKLGPAVSKRIGPHAGEVVVDLINETFEAAEREIPPPS